jgi:hypothetical protein
MAPIVLRGFSEVPPPLPQLRPGQLEQILAIVEHLPRCRRGKTENGAAGCAFARAGFADQPVGLAFIEAKRYIGYGMNLAAAAAPFAEGARYRKGLVQVNDINNRAWRTGRVT